MVERLLQKFEKLKNNPYKYTIWADTYDDKTHAYCLVRLLSDGTTEVLLSKSMTAGREFQEEVENLSKYFNVEEVQFQTPKTVKIKLCR